MMARFLAWSICLLTLLPDILAQTPDISIAQLESRLAKTYGYEKLVALNRLTEHYAKRQPRKALRYGKQAIALGERIQANDDPVRRTALVTAYNQLGRVLYMRASYFDAQEKFEKAIALVGDFNNAEGHYARAQLALIDSLVDEEALKPDFFKRTFGNLGVGEKISNTSQDIAIGAAISQGESKEMKKDYLGAIESYSRAMNLLQNTGKVDRINVVQLKIASLLDSVEQLEEAQVFLDKALEDIKIERVPERLPDLVTEPISIPERETVETKDESVVPTPKSSALQNEKESVRSRAEDFEREKDYQRSLELYKEYQALAQRYYADSLESELETERSEQQIQLLKQQKQITDLRLETVEAEKLQQQRQKNSLFYGALLVLLVTLVTLYFYLAKRREHKKLSVAYTDLDKAKTQLEDAEQRIVQLLAQQVSGDIADELLAHGSDKPGERRYVCIMFLDIRDFTRMAERMSPEQLIDYQNDVFSFMIDIILKHHGITNQLMGDGFMATFGAPVSHGNACQNAFDAAREILAELNERIASGVIPKTKVGIGLHAGHVVTGNVGNEQRKQYSVTGSTVIIASRVEQLNKTYKTQLIITEDVYNELDDPVHMDQPFVEVEVKGRTQPVKILKVA